MQRWRRSRRLHVPTSTVRSQDDIGQKANLPPDQIKLPPLVLRGNSRDHLGRFNDVGCRMGDAARRSVCLNARESLKSWSLSSGVFPASAWDASFLHDWTCGLWKSPLWSLLHKLIHTKARFRRGGRFPPWRLPNSTIALGFEVREVGASHSSPARLGT